MTPSMQFAAAAMLALVFFGVTGWLQALLRWWRGLPLIPYEPRRPAPWGVIDLLAVVAAFVLSQLLALLAIRVTLGSQPVELENANPHQLLVLLVAQGAANLLVGAIALVCVVARTKASWRDLGFVGSEVAQDVSIGVTAFFMLALPVFVVQSVLTQWFPSEHPLIKLLRDHSNPALYAVSVIVAVIIAPLVEELIFRGLLQGWLEAMASRASASPSNFVQGADGDMVFAKVANSVDNIAVRPAWWPIFVSAAIFALMHWGHGPDPIPLFLLAIGLGYLYRQTHRLLPSMTVHFLLNSLSMAALWLEIHHGGG